MVRVLATALCTAAVLLGAGWLIVDATSGDGSDVPQHFGTTPTAPPALAQAGPKLGPEGVPLLGGAPLGPAASPSKGHAAGGIVCGSGEQLTYHVHARLTLFVKGKPRSVPLGVGIGPPVQTSDSGSGRFASGGSCFSFLHTHAADGVIHIEAPGEIKFTLGQFFDVWKQPLERDRLGPVKGRVVAYLNGKRFRGNPRAIPLTKHAQIQLQVGQPLVSPPRIEFPAGL